MPPAWLVRLQGLLAAIGAQMLRTGVFQDAFWMIAPCWLIRRVAAAVALVREGLFAAVLEESARLVAARKVTPLFSRPKPVRHSREGPPSNASQTLRLLPPDPARRRLWVPKRTERRGMRMGRIRDRLAVLTAIAFETPAAHARRVRRLARAFVRRFDRPPRPQVTQITGPPPAATAPRRRPSDWRSDWPRTADPRAG